MERYCSEHQSHTSIAQHITLNLRHSRPGTRLLRDEPHEWGETQVADSDKLLHVHTLVSGWMRRNSWQVSLRPRRLILTLESRSGSTYNLDFSLINVA